MSDRLSNSAFDSEFSSEFSGEFSGEPTVGSHFPPRVIGLTGGVAMGKTTVSDYLANVYHLPVLDADLYARDAVEPGSKLLPELVERYGSGVLTPQGRLDRMRVGEIIFNRQPERLWIEQQIHPYVRDRLTTELKKLGQQGCATCVLAIPLLFEARMTDLTSEIWVVACPLDQQVERLMQREIEGSVRQHLSSTQVQARINSQMPIDQKIKLADVVLDNSSTLEALLLQVDTALNPTPASPSAGSSQL